MAKKNTAGDIKKKLNATSKGDDNLIAELRLVKFDENNNTKTFCPLEEL